MANKLRKFCTLLLGGSLLVSCFGETSSQRDQLLKQFAKGLPLPRPEFIMPPNSPLGLIDYRQFGHIENGETPQAFYKITRLNALRSSQIPGIYPNEEALAKSEMYREYEKQGLLEGNHWSFLSNPNLELAYCKWAMAHEEGGVKAFFTGVILEKAGLLVPALRAYHAVLVHFPRSVCYSQDGSFVWYVAKAALSNIERIVRDYPVLKLSFLEGDISIKNGHNLNLEDDIIHFNPGFFQATKKAFSPIDLETLKVLEVRGDHSIQFKKYENGHWQLLENNQPLTIKGITYGPTEVGIGPQNDPYFWIKWMFSDKNKNGLIDAPQESYIDANKNGQQDSDEISQGDFKILQDMGVNAIRLYNAPSKEGHYVPSNTNKELLRSMYKDYGIRVLMGDFLGAYAIGSGVSWEEGTDYTNPEQRERMKNIVKEMVLDLKDEPFILLWLLGNENNMASGNKSVNATRTNASAYPEAYATFLNEVAKMIHEIDPKHPVGVVNQGTHLIDYYGKFAPELDFIGVNAYLGGNGFGLMFKEIKKKFDRPVLLTEFGTDAYFHKKGEDEASQEAYYKGCMRDIILNHASGPGQGNCFGGVVFEYLDEWWKDTHGHSPALQQTKSQSAFASADGHSHEEWYGIASQGTGKNSPFERGLRKSYYYLKSLWNPNK